MAENADGTKSKVDSIFFCKQRMCRNCATVKAVNNAKCITAISQEMATEYKTTVFLTLTTTNVTGDKLRESITELNESWKRLMKTKQYSVFKHYIKKLEVSYNAETDTYHPHLHILIFASSSVTRGSYYISKQKLLQDWRKATRDPNITQVSIKYIKNQDNQDAIVRLSSYIAKTSECWINQQVFSTFYTALYRIRTLTYTGHCKELQQEYKRSRAAHPAPDADEYIYRIVYTWQQLANSGRYVQEQVLKYHSTKTRKSQEEFLDSQLFEDSKRIASTEDLTQDPEYMALLNSPVDLDDDV